MLSVRVLEADGTPVRGALVRRLDFPTGEARTDASGCCELATVDHVAPRIHVEVDGKHHEPFLGSAHEGEVRVFEVMDLAGRVLDAERRTPLAGAVVTHETDCPECAPSRAVTNAEGAFVLAGLPLRRSSAIVVEHPGHAANDFSFDLSRDPVHEGAGVTLLLERGRRIAGEVCDYVTGEPLAGVSVRPQRMWRVEPASTDERGRFELLVAGSVWASLRFERSGYCALAAHLPLDDVRSAPARIRLPRACPVEGVVRNARGTPLRGELVTIGELVSPEAFLKRAKSTYDVDPVTGMPGTWRFEPSGRLAARTDGDGVFRMDGGVVPWRDGYVAFVHREGKAVVRQDVARGEPGQTLRVELSLPNLLHGSVSGRVTVNGRPVHAVVRWSGHGHGSATTAADGSYRLANVAAGTVRLSAHPVLLAGRAPDLPELSATVPIAHARDTRHDFDLTVKTVPIAGRVTRPDGRPVVGTTVFVFGKPGYATATTESDGSYDAEQPEMGSPFTLQVGTGSTARFLRGVRPFATDADLVVPEFAPFRFRVVDERSGEDVRGFHYAHRLDGDEVFESPPLFVEAPDPQGRYAVDLALGAVDFVVHAEHLGYRPTLLRLARQRPEAEPTTIVLVPGWTVRFRLKPGSPPLPRGCLPVLVEEELRGSLPSMRASIPRRTTSSARAILPGADGLAEVAAVGPGTYAIEDLHAQVRIVPGKVELRHPRQEPIEITWRHVGKPR